MAPEMTYMWLKQTRLTWISKCGHHKTCDSLITSANHGCYICQTVWNVLSNVEQGSLRAADSNETNTSTADTSALAFITVAVLQRWVFPKKFCLDIRYNHELLPDIPKNKYKRFILEPDDGMLRPTKPHIRAYHIAECTSSQGVPIHGDFTSDRTSSIESIQTAAMWLQDCVGSHLSCNTPDRNSIWYPTRLLHLTDSSGDQSYVRLIRTAQELPVGPYSTLSHRWGNAMPFQLTQAMESDSNPCFPVIELPRTFQEAIQVSKQLGIWYLWIDSLCIIQSGDNRQDWSREASLMDLVYTHSQCNISATDAEDSTKGLFRDRTPQYVGRSRSKVNLNGLQPDGKHMECLMTDLLFWQHILQSSPLEKRAWVFQERYLAPRVLHFGPNQLFWECQEHTACETFPQGLPLVSLNFGSLFLKSQENIERRVSKQDRIPGRIHFPWYCADASQPQLPPLHTNHTKKENLERGTSQLQEPGQIVNDATETYWESLWAVLISDYSRKELTVPGDKLVALSGVAKHLRSRIKDVYVAGMWRRNLEVTLMWYVTAIRRRPPSYRAPSWSWASVDGMVWLDSTIERQSLIRIEDVVLDHATEDSTGAVTGGWLDLCGCLKPMRLQGIKREASTVWHIIVDTSNVSEHRCNTTLEEPFECDLDTLHHEVSAFDDDNTERRLFFMPGLIDGGSDEGPLLRCLLLRLENSKNKTFERIGIVGSGLDHVKEMLLADLDEEMKAHLPCLRYENGLHTIRIV
jgi:hypothetical protein